MGIRCHTDGITDRSTDRPTPLTKTAELERSPTLWLLLACVVALGMRLFAGTFLGLDHNGAWHVFIARFFRREWMTPAHPPLFPFLLQGPDALSHTLLSYRMIPILAGVASVFLTGWVLRKLGALPVVAVLGALTMACAQTATVLALAVEGYTLAVFFTLASFGFALDLVEADEPPPARSRLGFALFASLGLLSHYFSALYLAALAASVGLACVLRPDYRRRLALALPRRFRADLLTAAPPLLIGAVLYFVLVRRWAGISLGNFDPSRESVGAYLARGLANTVNLFSPLPLRPALIAIAFLGLFLAVAVWAAASERGSRVRRLIPSLLLCAMVVIGMILGATGRYPLGDAMRRQFLFFVFALLAGFTAFDRWMRALSAGRRRVLALVAAGAIGADVLVNARGYTTPPFEILEVKRGIYRQHLSDARTVHLDRLNLVGLMMEYYLWDWRFLGDDPTDGSVRRYALSLDGARLGAVAHWRWWRLDYLDPAFYRELAATWDRREGACQTLFAVYQNIYKDTHRITAEKRAEVEARIRALAEAEGFEIRRLAVDDDDVDLELCRPAL